MRAPAILLSVPLALATAACRKEAPPASTKAAPAAGLAAEAAVPGEPADPAEKATDPAETLDRITTAAREGDREKVLEHWSTGALVDELARRGLLGDLDDAARARAHEAVTGHFDLLFSYLARCIGESRRPVMVMAAGPPGNGTPTGELLSIRVDRTRQHDGSRDTVVRYWFLHGRLVDCEDITLGYRASTLLLGLLAPADARWRPPLIALLEKISRSDKESTFELALTVAGEVDALLAANPPDDLRAFGLKLKAERWIMQRKPADALKVIKEFASLEPWSPWADYLRGLALMNLHRGFEAITAFRRHAEKVGWEANTHEYVAWCHFSQGDERSALEHAKKGLELDHNACDCLVTAVLSSKPEEIAGLAGYFNNTFDPENTFEYVLDQVMEMKDPKFARAVFSLLEKELPASKLVATYRKKLATSTE